MPQVGSNHPICAFIHTILIFQSLWCITMNPTDGKCFRIAASNYINGIVSTEMDFQVFLGKVGRK